MDEKVVKNFIDSFLKMCDFIEQTDVIGCGKCPVYHIMIVLVENMQDYIN